MKKDLLKMVDATIGKEHCIFTDSKTGEKKEYDKHYIVLCVNGKETYLPIVIDSKAFEALDMLGLIEYL